MKLFGEYLRKLREEQNLPLRKVAAHLDIDTSILSKIERNERPINIDLISKVADFFDLDENQLLIDYYGEEIAKKVYLENNISEIFEVAEKKIEYLKIRTSKQGKLDFNE